MHNTLMQLASILVTPARDVNWPKGDQAMLAVRKGIRSD